MIIGSFSVAITHQKLPKTQAAYQPAGEYGLHVAAHHKHYFIMIASTFPLNSNYIHFANPGLNFTFKGMWVDLHVNFPAQVEFWRMLWK